GLTLSSGSAYSRQPGTSATSGNGSPNGRVASTPTADIARLASAAVSPTDGSSGPAGIFSTKNMSRAGWTRNDSAHSTSAESNTSMSGSTITTHFGRMLLA